MHPCVMMQAISGWLKCVCGNSRIFESTDIVHMATFWFCPNDRLSWGSVSVSQEIQVKLAGQHCCCFNQRSGFCSGLCDFLFFASTQSPAEIKPELHRLNTVCVILCTSVLNTCLHLSLCGTSALDILCYTCMSQQIKNAAN